MHIDVWIGRTLLGRYEKTATSWLGDFASGNIRHDYITAGGLLEKSGMVFGIIAGDIYAYTGLGTRESIGYGDGLVILGMGCFYALGEIMGIVMIAITIAGITALGLLVFGHKNRKSEFPFVPFLLGAHLVMWGLQG